MADTILWKNATRQTLATALGQEHRDDPVLPRTGGPAGNATLTAWIGMVLLVLFAAEGLTLLDVHGLISWHLAIGVVLIPPALAKTATTGWRIVRYYTGNPAYREAGPPPLVLRLLGPLVVVTTLAVLGSGVALVLLGADGSRQALLTIGPLRLDAVGLHKVSFVVWFAVMTAHVLARLVSAWQLVQTRRRRLPGRSWRGAALLVSGALAVAGAVWILGNQGGWQVQQGPFAHDQEEHGMAVVSGH